MRKQVNAVKPDNLAAMYEWALENSNVTQLEQYFRKHASAEIFSPLLAANLQARLFPTQLFPVDGDLSFDNWLLQIDSWLDHILDPRSRISARESLLHLVWDHFSSSLTQALRIARISTGIPPRGGVLAYIGNLAKCLVIEYRFAAAWPRLKPVAIISNPRSAFDVYLAVDQADQAARNSLKAILASGHKLINHRGVLVHVDRRKESNVFGPSIDTLVLAEVLDADYFQKAEVSAPANGDAPKTALEIGTGSGLLSAALIRYVPSLHELVCVDAEFAAIRCTEKNIAVARRIPGANRKATVQLLCGPFDKTLLNRRFDLIVCNPPYIPLPPDMLTSTDQSPDYFRAVAGLDLLRDVLAAAPAMLTDRGRLLLMTSNICWDDVQKLLPPSCHVSRPLGENGFEALFDVEAVLHQNRWLDFLSQQRGLTKRAGAYYHVLHPVWITFNGCK